MDARIDLIRQALGVLNVALRVSGDTQEYRNLIATAVSEGRDITNDEILDVRQAAVDAIDKARNG